MSPRPRKVTDDQLFAAAHAAMNRLGPGELTLAAIAREAGVTAAVLVQRFGSKRDLLLALSKQFSEGIGDLISRLASEQPSPLAALRAYVGCMAEMAASPAALARSLAYLQIDLTDAEFRRHLVKGARASRAALERLVRAAQQAGDLRADAKPARLARTIEAVTNGSMLSWAFYQEGSAKDWMRSDLDAVLAPYIATARKHARRKRPRR